MCAARDMNGIGVIRLRSCHRERGFTLMEIMVVVIIIGMLMTLVATTIFGRLEQSKVDIASMQVQKLSQALELYKLDNGTYPTSEQGLDAPVDVYLGEETLDEMCLGVFGVA